MVKIVENPIKMDDLGGKPTIFGNIHIDHHGTKIACDEFGVPQASAAPPSWLPERCATGMPRGLEARLGLEAKLLVFESENPTLNIQNRVRRSSKVVWNTSQNKTWKFESKPVYISDSLH